MRRLRLPNPDLSKSEKTYLDADYSSGTTLTVVNNYGFANDNIVIVGEVGEEKSECKDVTGQTGNTVIDIAGALKFSHNKGQVVYRYEYDQVEIYRYRTSAWSLISTSNLQWDKRETIYVDDNGLATDSYRYRFVNSASAATSDYSPTVAATGFTNDQVGYMIREIRRILGDDERRFVSDDEIIRQFNRAQNIIQSIREDWWFLRTTSSSITTVANTSKYGLNTYCSDLNFVDTVRYRFNDSTTDVTYNLNKVTNIEMDYEVRDNDATADDYPEEYNIEPPDSTDATGYITIDKKSKTTGYGTFYIRYFKKMTDLDDVSDATLVPMPSILEDFALAYGFRVKGDEQRAKIYEERFWGPQPGREEKYREQTGIRLLQLMQSGKGRAIGQPRSFKKWRGRQPMGKFFQSHEVNTDDLRERYY